MRLRWYVIAAAATVSVAAAVVLAARGRTAKESFDPLAAARAAGPVKNREATVPPMCYTATAGVSNPCWTCHTVGVAPNHLDDSRLQEEYSFSAAALDNHWQNLFAEPGGAALSDREILQWIRQDNYGALRRDLAALPDYPGFRPDLELFPARGEPFDQAGFAADGSGWRAMRYQPFPGHFWPSNGSAGDVMVRLPRELTPTRELARVNYALLEAAIGATPEVPTAALVREVEPIDEAVAGMDLDGDGRVGGVVTRVRGLPVRFAGGTVPLERYQVPVGTEILHTVRYLDPDQPTLLSRRLKELRYMRKTRRLDGWAYVRAHERAVNQKEEGILPRFAGAPAVGFVNDFGWQLQSFIEDARGRLRVQTEEEQLACMGCHGGIGITTDTTFSLARKLPGAAGWRPQDLRGMIDRPEVGHDAPEVLTYLERVGGGDELRANDEMTTRFFDARGQLRASEVGRAAAGGDRDLAWLLAPSRARALALDKAYLALVRLQRFHLGRAALLSRPRFVHARIENGSTDLATTGKVFRDGRLHLRWD